eukprot:scaffold59922_cov49-Phaeocystis_antarctica.AAC.1
MSYVFYNFKNFDADVSSWDTSGVTNMFRMFYGAAAFNQPLSFDTSSVTTMYQMFYGAAAFNQPLSFDTSSVTNMQSIFENASAFNQPLSFDTSGVTNMYRMFRVRSSSLLLRICSQALPCTLRAPRSPSASHHPGRTSSRTAHALLPTLGRARRRSTSR